jgi:NADH dehydrogenase (ubiquinone) 1 alpha subcomplex subunit 5
MFCSKTLTELYGQTLAAMASIPATAAYRCNVEKITQHRMTIVAETEDVDSIEAKLGIGQIEEVIEIARDELDLIPHMIEWQPWKVEKGKGKCKIELID